MSPTKIVLATSNPDKAKEIFSILGNAYLRRRKIQLIPLRKLKIILPPETGKTIRENAIRKSKQAAKLTGLWALAEDTGLEVKELNNAPGVYSARFAGESCSYEENNRKLLKMLQDLPYWRREAHFRTVVALTSPSGRTWVAEGTLSGFISKEMRGKSGFGYDPVFVVPEYKKTLAELGMKIKNKISHRSRAFQKMKLLIDRLIKDGLFR